MVAEPLVLSGPKTPEVFTIWAAQPGPQTAFLACPCSERCYGGARGGGKTDTMIADFAIHAEENGCHAKGVFFRRYLTELEEVIARSHEIYPKMGWEWQGTKKIWTSPQGARLKMRYLEHEKDALLYQGHSYTWLCFEEGTAWASPEAMNKLRATLRSPAGVRVRLNMTANPGGPGHDWVKRRYIDPAPSGYKVILDRRTGMEYVFIPSRLEDNLILTANDPTYENRLLGSSSNEMMVQAWRWGIWDILQAGFFARVWDQRNVLLKQFEIPPSWRFGYSFDWGKSRPASLGIWATSDGTAPYVGPYKGRPFPPGSTIRVDEIYFAAPAEDGVGYEPNVGADLTNFEMGMEIGARLFKHRRNWSYAIADPAVFAEMGGPSIYDQLVSGSRSKGFNLRFEPADNSRIPGWGRMADMLRNSGSIEHPGLYAFDNCTEWIRTIPVLQTDKREPDDVDSDGEDHAADETRYYVMALPLPNLKAISTKKRFSL